MRVDCLKSKQSNDYDGLQIDTNAYVIYWHLTIVPST